MAAPRPFAPKPRQDPQIAVEHLPVESLKFDSRNPNRHERRQIEKIAKSIKRFGFLVPVLVDGDRTLIAGEGRARAAKTLGMPMIPAIEIGHLSQAQLTAFMIADNQLCRTGEWNDRLLAEALKDLADLDLNLDLEATGFEMGEIDFRIGSLDVQAKDTDPADVAPAHEPGPAVSQRGDLWLLGSHRAGCDDALDRSAYERLMQGQRAAAVFTDPPYNVKIEGHASGLGRIQHRDFAMASGEMNEAEFTRFLSTACSLLAQHTVPGSLHYLCMDWRHLRELLAAGLETYRELINLCVWVKHNGGMGSLYRSQHELVLVFKNGRGRHRNNVQLGQHGRHRTNVWSYPAINDFGRSGDEVNLLALHPTVKPVAMVADAIMDCTARGEIVLDPFLGSGTTVIAAQRTGRRCFGLEIDPLYVDTIVRRWQAFTRDDARHAATGRRFDDIARQGRKRHGR
jgi:DNA modification methylase